jgi:hypothetical protein
MRRGHDAVGDQLVQQPQGAVHLQAIRQSLLAQAAIAGQQRNALRSGQEITRHIGQRAVAMLGHQIEQLRDRR